MNQHKQILRQIDDANHAVKLSEYKKIRDGLAWRYSFAGRFAFWKRRQAMKGPKRQMKRGCLVGLPIGVLIGYVWWLLIWGWG